jgi:hypothetical protein
MNKLVSLWLLSLALVALIASVVTAQVTRTPARVVTGGDLGFRVEGTDTQGRPVGSVVIKVNGEWVAVRDSMKATPATSR